MDDEELDNLRHAAKHREMEGTCDDCRQKKIDSLLENILKELDGFQMEDAILLAAKLASFLISDVDYEERMRLLGTLNHAIVSMIGDDFRDDEHEDGNENETEDNGGKDNSLLN